MTKKEAVSFLTTAGWKQHRVVSNTIGPSHGDPGGQRQFSERESCACLIYDHRSGRITTGDEKLCNCGAVAHNQKLQAALIELGSPPKTTRS